MLFEIGVIWRIIKMFDMIDTSEIEAYSGELRPCVTVVVVAGLSGESKVATVGPVPLVVRGIDVRALGLSLLWLGRR